MPKDDFERFHKKTVERLRKKYSGIRPNEVHVEGAKFDHGKDRYDLVPELAEQAWVRVLTFGANKYTRELPDGTLVDGAENWRKVKDPKKRYFAALRRHLKDYRLGRPADKDSGFHVLAHAMCDLSFLLELELEEEALRRHDAGHERLGDVAGPVGDGVRRGGRERLRGGGKQRQRRKHGR